MKKTLIILIYILVLFTCINITYASNDITVELKMDNTNLKQGDETSVAVSITNNSSEEVYSIYGNLLFDDTIFELVTIKEEELDEEIKDLINELSQAEGIELEILCQKDNWLIGVIKEENENILYTMYLEDDGGIPTGETEEIGQIKYRVLESAISGTTELGIEECIVNDEISLGDIKTETIKITGSSSNQENEYQEIETEEEIIADEAKQNLVYTGTEDVIPFMFIAVVVTIVSYINLKKYKNI